MAASILLSPLFQVILDKVNSLITEEISVVSGVEKELMKLSSTLSLINGVLEDASEKQVKERSVRNWLKELKDTAYEADNILDEWATEALRWKVEGGFDHESHKTQVSKLFSSCFCFNKVVFRHSIGCKIKEIREKLQEIEMKRFCYDLKLVAPEKPVDIRETGPFVEESIVLGRGADKEKIINLLLSDECSRENASIIPIVGIGGLGKTTLAQFVYNDERVKKHFELQMWVCVSDDFDVKMLIKRIIESATGKRSESLDLALLQHRLREALSGKQFLLVLDDVWNENHEKWDSLRHLLRCDGSGSRIIVTTRSEKVASIMGTTPSIQLKGLSEDDCWLLFKQRVFGERNEEEVPPNLEAIGKEIVKKSKGVPLAVKALGGLLHLKRSESEWLFVKESEIWELQEDENEILNVLRLSYNHLPSHLKQCFAYCSVFPKDDTIEKEKLIRLWMAQGFIQPSKGAKQMEDIGSDYFDHLLWRSFFQDVEKDGDGNIISCKMHDLIHDLAQSVADSECSFIDTSESSIVPKKALHLSLFNDGMDPAIIRDALSQSKNLRTLMFFRSRSWFVEGLSTVFSHFKHLRVLDLSFCFIRVLPDSIGKLKHLRYLNLRGTEIVSLPDSICNLWNLQTLDMRECYFINGRLPKDMSNMINLRHLNIDVRGIDFMPAGNLDVRGIDFTPAGIGKLRNMNSLRHLNLDVRGIDFMPAGIGKLTCLQTWPKFIVGNESGCGIGELKDLNLKGELIITNLENVMNKQEAMGVKLKTKQHLQFLSFHWNVDRNVNARLKEVEKEVLDGLEPHANLKRLSISGYSGDTLPSWLTDNSSLSNMVEIELSNCKNCEILPLFGKMQFLKKLQISDMDRVKYLSNEYCREGDALGFPVLEELSLSFMSNLEEWSRIGNGKISCLRKLYISHCPKLRSLPVLPYLERLTLHRCDMGIFRFLHHLSTLSSLNLECFKELTSLGEGLRYLTALKELAIKSCGDIETILEHLPTTLETLQIFDVANLISLPMDQSQNNGGLRVLRISDCPKLTSLTDGLQNLTALQNLDIWRCPMLTLPERMHHLSALKSLSLSDFPNMSCLPEPLQHLTTIERLDIWSCDELSSLPEWIGDLSTLRSLYIERCPKLGSLPEGLQRLTRLEALCIYCCPISKKRCKQGGEDWHKIQHIPSVVFCGD